MTSIMSRPQRVAPPAPAVPSPSMRGRLPRGATAMAIAVAAQTAANIVFHGVVSRSLDPVSYGTMGTLLGLMIMLTVPLGSLQAALARVSATRPDEASFGVVARIALVAAALSLVVAGAAPAVGGFLHVDALIVVLLVAPYLFQATVLAGARGVLLGHERAGLVAAAMGGATVLRLALGAALAPVAGVTGALLATLVAEVVGLAVLVVAVARSDRRLRRSARARRDVTAGSVLAAGAPAGPVAAPRLKLPALELGRAGAVVVGLWLFTSVDLLLARHWLSGSASGSYVAASTLARCVMALPAALVMVALPRFAAGSSTVARAALGRLLAVVGLVAGAAAVALAVGAGFAQQLLFGRTLAPSALVIALGAIAAVSSLATSMTYFHLARARRAALLPWAGAALEVALIAWHHASPAEIARGSALATVPAVVALGWSVLAERAAPVAARGIEAELVASSTGPDDEPDPDPDPDPTPSGPAFDPALPLWRPARPGVDLTVVVPFYNPGPSVGTTVARTVEVLDAAGIGFEVVAVSDGSTDGSEAHLAGLDDRVRVLVSPRNEGKGAAVRRGMAQATGAHVAFIDADGDIDPAHLVDLLTRLRQGEHDLVYAAKTDPASTSASSGVRKLISRTYSGLVALAFPSLRRCGVDDTQTGCKVLRRSVAAAVVPFLQERRFALDLELFVVACRLGFDDLAPAPVHLQERLAGSTVTGRAVLRTMGDTWRIRRRLHDGHSYPSAAPATVLTPAPATVSSVLLGRRLAAVLDDDLVAPAPALTPVHGWADRPTALVPQGISARDREQRLRAA